MRGLPFLPVFAATFVTVAAGAPPALESVFPPGGRQGAEVELTLVGKFEPWPCSLWCSVPGVSFVADPAKPGKGVLKLAPEAPVGPVLLRAWSPEGASQPVIFVVGSLPELNEKEEDASTLAKAMPLDRAQIPETLNGTFSTGGELDTFRIALEKGETLHARVEAYGLRSLVDPALHVYDAAGNRLELVHDGVLNLDPGLAFTAPEKGDYLISLAGFAHPPAASVAYTGTKNLHYRLHLAWKPEQLPARLLPVDPGADSPVGPLVVGQPVVGSLSGETRELGWTLAAKKGEVYLLRVEGRELGLPIDPVMRLLRPDGAEIRREDDTPKSKDIEYLWTVAIDGEYRIVVSDRFSRTGDGMRFRLSATLPVPSVSATLDKSEYLLERGKSVELKAALVRRHGHQGELEFAIEGLPEGVTLEAPASIPEKNGDVVLKLTAKDSVPAHSAPIRVVVKPKGGDKGEPVVFSFANDANWRGRYAVEAVEAIWLTVPPPPKPATPPAEDAKKPAPPAKPAAPPKAAEKPTAPPKPATPPAGDAKKPAPQAKSAAPPKAATPPAEEAKKPAPQAKPATPPATEAAKKEAPPQKP